MAMRAFISGISGSSLLPSERRFLRDADPWGVILFTRNVDTPLQVKRLTASIREALGRDAPVLVDQEGGRIQRLGPPYWPSYPCGATYGAIFDRCPEKGTRAAYLGAYLIAVDLLEVGINVNCIPVADLPIAGASDVIGDRAYGKTAEKVSAIGRSVADGLLHCGVVPVLKHIPGHGRARTDSHEELPIVDADFSTLLATDFAAFRSLRDLPIGMTAHVVYAAVDSLAPATTSATVIGTVIRDCIGFSGLLVSDDICMAALSGPLEQRSRAAIAAGCDVVLHCSGSLAEMEEVAAAVPLLEGQAMARSEVALACRWQPADHDHAELRRELQMILAAPSRRMRASA
jgi:beta-N-acetylhexosaminidase